MHIIGREIVPQPLHPTTIDPDTATTIISINKIDTTVTHMLQCRLPIDYVTQFHYRLENTLTKSGIDQYHSITVLFNRYCLPLLFSLITLLLPLSLHHFLSSSYHFKLSFIHGWSLNCLSLFHSSFVTYLLDSSHSSRYRLIDVQHVSFNCSIDYTIQSLSATYDMLWVICIACFSVHHHESSRSYNNWILID